MRRWVRGALAGGLTLVGLPLAVVLAALVTEYRPADQEALVVSGPTDLPALRVGEPLVVVSWNIQFSGSRKHHFFYDGGRAVHVPDADVAETVDAVAAALAAMAPDLTLLQEVDRDSTRTGRRDQLRAYLDRLPPSRWAAAPYFRAPFVPAPSHQPMGRVDMSLATLSRRGLTAATRTQLPLLDEPRLRQMFNLKRALLTAEVPIEGSPLPLQVANTHLSAFSHGDGTLAKQVAVLRAWMASHPPEQPWILAGDLNLLPPGDDPHRLSTESALYADTHNPIEAILPAFQEAFADPLAAAARTYLPFGATEPDRKIDYVFVGGPVEVLDAVVLRQHDLSDHLPVKVTLRITP